MYKNNIAWVVFASKLITSFAVKNYTGGGVKAIMSKSPFARAGGRPRKFSEPSTRTTITLPRSTLKDLAAIHGDRAQAIVRATRAAMGGVP